jgi:RNA polymerase sigma factor (TIGR02999 family)
MAGSVLPFAFELPALAQRLHSAFMSDVTRLLEAAAAGDRKAADALLPLVYDELRKLAAVRMSAEAPGHTLDATALVHEAYLRLVGDQQFEGRGHFFAAAAEAMRRVLVDHARDRNRLKRGGGRRRVDLDRLTDLAAATDDDLLGLDDALGRLAEDYPAAAELVKLRFFAGVTLAEAADALGLSDRTADRYWVFARTWLADALTRG